MPKAYWIAHVTVTDPEPYALYAAGATEAFRKFNARVLARGGKCEQLEGDGHPRNVVIEFDTLDAALSCYNSPEYQAAKNHRLGAGIANIVIVEGAET
ncbi:DUF1330 domain-containing protein [Leisingera aquaemixtae]|uniref:DUF1330 domain-containing protein n=1 Tax=Leisingera aquaemixtae TaxID=1396826 RepID=UPI001C98B70D|nr:DUF1330 domain-containing protein [Leisingera aquaemixtae]MBY6067144.1 DUF1330 domain-containing protein [Leisingera aquaemixtae]